MTETLITTDEAAVILGRSKRTVTRLAEAGKLPFVTKLPGSRGAYLFRNEVVELVARTAADRVAGTSNGNKN